MKNKTTILISGLVIATIIILATWQLSQNKNFEGEVNVVVGDAGARVEEIDTEDMEGEESQLEELAYINGEYTATGAYTSPAGEEEIVITLTLTDGAITEAAFEGKATHPTSQRLQAKFEEGFEEAVLGQSIDTLSLTVVNGSSLTPKGFNDALEQIKKEAQS